MFYDAVYVTHGLWDFVDDYMHHHPELTAVAEKNGFQVCVCVCVCVCARANAPPYARSSMGGVNGG